MLGAAVIFRADAAGRGVSRPFTPLLSVAINESYDNNVMLQDRGAQAGYESFVTSVLPVIGASVSRQGATAYSSGLRYQPDFSFYHELSRESYLRHVGLFDFGVTHQDFSAKAEVKMQYTDGSTEPPTWGTPAAPGAVPAFGATEVRNRRRNVYFVSGFDAREDLGRAFVRGAFDARIWDFMTEDLVPPSGSGYTVQNYYDRNDLSGGVDFGVALKDAVEVYVGFRLGHQDQEYRVTSPSYSYQNTYYRATAGLTARASAWLSFSGEIGPSFHFFDAATIAPGTATQQDYLYFMASATIQIATNTSLKLTTGQYLIPASAGNGVYQNTAASGTLRHKFTSRLQASFTLAYAEYDFFAAFIRDDRRLAPALRLDYAFGKHLSLGGWYSYENAWSNIPDTSDRNYTHSIVGLGIQATY
jgi:hypothetical protein